MKSPAPLSMSRLAGAGMGVMATIVVGLVLGLLAARYLHWQWAVPFGIVLGFIAGLVSLFRQLKAQM